MGGWLCQFHLFKDAPHMTWRINARVIKRNRVLRVDLLARDKEKPPHKLIHSIRAKLLVVLAPCTGIKKK